MVTCSSDLGSSIGTLFTRVTRVAQSKSAQRSPSVVSGSDSSQVHSFIHKSVVSLTDPVESRHGRLGSSQDGSQAFTNHWIHEWWAMLGVWED